MVGSHFISVHLAAINSKFRIFIVIIRHLHIFSVKYGIPSKYCHIVDTCHLWGFLIMYYHQLGLQYCLISPLICQTDGDLLFFIQKCHIWHSLIAHYNLCVILHRFHKFLRFRLLLRIPPCHTLFCCPHRWCHINISRFCLRWFFL